MGYKLAPGEDSISECTPVRQPDGTYWLEWRFKPSDGGRTLVRRSKGKTIAITKQRARAKAAEMRQSGSGAWKVGDGLADYAEKVAMPAMAKANLKPLTRTRYDIAMRLLLGDCGRHRHLHGLRRHTIASGARFAPLEDLLTEIASLHGRETARQSRTVLTKYILTRLTRDELISGNPIAGVSLDELTGTTKAPRIRGGKALTRAQYESVLTYLLERDPAEGVVRRQGRWTLEQRISKRRNAIDQSVIQAATGLRRTEANLLTWDRHILDDGTAMSINVTADIAKGGIPRVALVLDDRVADRIRQRRRRARSKKHYVIGEPTDQAQPWDIANATKAARELYMEIADKVGVEVLETERTHVWRTTLHMLYAGAVPTAVLDSQFGNSEDIRAKHYTDPSDLSALRDAARRVREA